MKNKAGKVLNEQEEVNSRWKKNYQGLYNEENPVIEEAARSLPIIVTDETEPSLLKDEVESAMKKLSDDKAPVFDRVSAEEAAGKEHKYSTKYANKYWKLNSFLRTGKSHHNTNLQKRRTDWIAEITKVSACVLMPGR